MSKCDDCGITPGYEGGVFCTNCKPITNYDLLIRKSPEELALMLENTGDCPPIDCPHDGKGAEVTRRDCKACWLNWLRQEAPTDG